MQRNSINSDSIETSDVSLIRKKYKELFDRALSSKKNEAILLYENVIYQINQIPPTHQSYTDLSDLASAYFNIGRHSKLKMRKENYASAIFYIQNAIAKNPIKKSGYASLGLYFVRINNVLVAIDSESENDSEQIYLLRNAFQAFTKTKKLSRLYLDALIVCCEKLSKLDITREEKEAVIRAGIKALLSKLNQPLTRISLKMLVYFKYELAQLVTNQDEKVELLCESRKVFLSIPIYSRGNDEWVMFIKSTDDLSEYISSRDQLKVLKETHSEGSKGTWMNPTFYIYKSKLEKNIKSIKKELKNDSLIDAEIKAISEIDTSLMSDIEIFRVYSAQCHRLLALTKESDRVARKFYLLKSIKYLKQIPITSRSNADYEKSAQDEATLSTLVKSKRKRKLWKQQAIYSLSFVTPITYSASYMTFCLHRELAELYTLKKERLPHYQNAVAAFYLIPESMRTDIHWNALAAVHLSIASAMPSLHFDDYINQLKLACAALNCSLAFKNTVYAKRKLANTLLKTMKAFEENNKFRSEMVLDAFLAIEIEERTQKDWLNLYHAHLNIGYILKNNESAYHYEQAILSLYRANKFEKSIFSKLIHLHLYSSAYKLLLPKTLSGSMLYNIYFIASNLNFLHTEKLAILHGDVLSNHKNSNAEPLKAWVTLLKALTWEFKKPHFVSNFRFNTGKSFLPDDLPRMLGEAKEALKTSKNIPLTPALFQLERISNIANALNNLTIRVEAVKQLHMQSVANNPMSIFARKNEVKANSENNALNLKPLKRFS